MLGARATRASCSGSCLFIGLNIAKGGYCTAFLGNLLQCLISPQFLFSFKWNVLYFSLWPLPCFWDTAEKNLSPCSLLPTLMRCPQRRFFYDLNRPISLSLCLNKRYSWRWYCLIIFMALNGHAPACPGSSEWQHNHPVYQPLLPVWDYQQTWWRCTLLHHPSSLMTEGYWPQYQPLE